MPYTITKDITFCYAHRLMTHPGKCRQLHGHNALVRITLTRATLNDAGMVVDFGVIAQTLKTWIDDHLDHTTILHERDPLIPLLQMNDPATKIFRCSEQHPTAEFLAQLLFDVCATLYPEETECVTVFETPTSSATYCR